MVVEEKIVQIERRKRRGLSEARKQPKEGLDEDGGSCVFCFLSSSSWGW